MIPRVLFLLIVAFWVVMNTLLWHAEYDSHGLGVRVPTALVWHKMLTAPDISSLNVFQDGERTGFCEFSTSVEQEMATLNEGDPAPESFNSRAGYQIRFSGNVSIGDFTNRLTFSGQMEFSHQREWRRLNLKLSSHFMVIEIHSVAAEQTVHLRITSGGATNEEVFSFADLENPNKLWRSLMGGFGNEWLADLDLPLVPQAPTALMQDIHWEAHRDRLVLDGEQVSVYRLETSVLGHPVVIYVSMLGEILRAELPGGVVASFGQEDSPQNTRRD